VPLRVRRIERTAAATFSMNIHRIPQNMHKSIASLQRLAFDEEGGAYTLSYVMVMPFVMLFMCLVVETTLMLSAKLGTVYSAYAGARVALVWSSATDWTNAERRIHKAAKQAFVPFASGSSSNRGSNDSATSSDAGKYYESYSAYVDESVSEAYVNKKYKNAFSSLDVETNGPPVSWDSDITVTVSYECPFRIPGIGRLLGEEDGNGGYYFPLTSQATLQNDGPQNDTQTLGIGYGTLE